MKNFWKITKFVLLFIVVLIVGVSVIYWENDIPLEVLIKKYANLESKFVQIDGMSVHYRDEGNQNDTIPVILIHGTGASLHTWEGWVRELKTEHRIIRLDLPAYGLTGPNPTGDYSQDYYAEFINHFLNELHIKQCILGGNSLGGAITWVYALKYPEKVKKMILVDAGGYPMLSKSVPIAFQMARIPVIKTLFKYITPRSIIEKSVQNVYAQKEKVTPELVDRYFELSLRAGNRGAFLDRISQNITNNNYLKIKTLQMPTLIIWGDKDLLIPLDVAEKFHHDLSNDTLVVFKNLGHTPMEEDAHNTVAVVKDFLKK
ncbi:alpha/beta fold hydrolase [Emticicia sp. SJ17W-69]|uniref:alpha/beta fold hydrolase n=1 Tax=Emticicia sp. SJ17W-69 TaxID=3421657 RepID=UPI003EB8031E